MLYNQVMVIPKEDQAIQKSVELLCQWLECEPSQASLAVPGPKGLRKLGGGPNAIIELNDVVFVVEYQRSGKVGSVARGIRGLGEMKSEHANTVKLLVVPFMRELGRKRCQEAGISWLDLSGNADIAGPDIRIYIEGRPNRFKQPGRPTNVFAPKSSRVAKVLLYHQGLAFIQRELSQRAGLGEDYVSRIVRALETQELIERDEDGAVTVKDPELLLDAWVESYDFSKHTLIRGHIPARSGSALLEDLGESLSREGIKHAATGLGAAWLYTHFAAFRTVTFFVGESIDSRTLSSLDFRESDIGPNTWLVVPNDESVFWQVDEVEGIQCVHPIQAYLDLKAHPERAKEAMSEIRRLILGSQHR